jgi:5-methyltetrahydrofolate--homocysteine methyltransferase
MQNKQHWNTAKASFYHISKTYQRQLRQNLTPAERVFWQLVRNKQLGGFKFRRQHIIDVFIVDFVCLKANLVIEVDGEIHDFQKEYDEARTKYLNEMNFSIIRFTNKEVLENLNLVKQKIIAHLDNFASPDPS